ncbi:hypothetical protein [Thalassococcus sp. S3]|uniref:hypothetical protein n=1 Tax=Thalassococcus sp. S3 TaxID=2017482 RepID=UPI00102415B1|nr:hypothetical protein [Thalassococcus sp. S3]QBF32391.1 hypothetical protein CFI11_14380 [Thalassococcus sp. S3]
MRVLLLCLGLCLISGPLAAQDDLGLSAPPAITESAFLRHLLPRFSLKTGIRVVADANGPMALTPEPPGTPVFEARGVLYYLRIDEDARQDRFRDWLTSDIGKRTIAAFPGDPVFSAPVAAAASESAPLFEGDLALGAELSLTMCGRCHVIGPQNAKNGIDSTPSFAVLKTLPDWEDRFQQFYVLRPHGAFTQIAGVTEPFDPERPSPIVPVEMTLENLDAILAYVAASPTADLGAPLQTQ